MKYGHTEQIKIILASGSPRRKEILSQAGYEFEVEVSEADENVSEEDPFRLVEELSRRKAMAVADHYMKEQDPGRQGGYLIIGADTIVVLDGQILGKPSDEAHAFSMLKKLSGRTHQVCTGVTLISICQGKITDSFSFHEKTDVVMREMADQEILDYIATEDPMDKAGAYGIQGMAGMFISGIRGDYYNVVGLPLCATVMALNNCKKKFLQRIVE